MHFKRRAARAAAQTKTSRGPLQPKALGPASTSQADRSLDESAYQEPSPVYRVTVKLRGWRVAMNGLIYLIGLIVVILAILSFFGLR